MEAKIFDIVEQFNRAAGLITEEAEKLKLAALNLRAGKKARASNAYQTAVRCFETGRRLLPEDAWEEQYDLMFAFHRWGGEAECLTGNYEPANTLLDLALAHVRSTPDKATIYKLKFVTLNNQARYLEGAYLVIKVLNTLFGFDMPFPDQPERIQEATAAEIARYEEYRRTHQLEDLRNLPPVEDETIKACFEMMGVLG
ncbi:MAG: hypothetical protein GY868_10660, partial [Deltaproteobacteria bacterium]|nr:hypothetical protein [Deltaproteobacteria bacterium]